MTIINTAQLKDADSIKIDYSNIENALMIKDTKI